MQNFRTFHSGRGPACEEHQSRGRFVSLLSETHESQTAAGSGPKFLPRLDVPLQTPPPFGLLHSRPVFPDVFPNMVLFGLQKLGLGRTEANEIEVIDLQLLGHQEPSCRGLRAVLESRGGMMLGDAGSI